MTLVKRMDSVNQRIVLVEEGETIYPSDIADRHHTASVGFGADGDYLATVHGADKCIEHLKTIMIAVKEGADVEVIVKPKDEIAAFAAVRRELNKEIDAMRFSTNPTPAAEFDEKLHDTIMKLMARKGDEFLTTDFIIETARQICDACKIKP